MTAPIAIQLYSVRDTLNDDFNGVVKQVAEMGYVGVETAGFPGTTPVDAAKLFQELGLKVSSAHSPMPLGEQKEEVLATMAALGCEHLISPWTDPKNYANVEAIKKAAEVFNEAYVVCSANGLKFSIHNHDFEMALVDGRPAYQILIDYVDPGVMFQVDTYWAKVAGLDAAEVVADLGDRAPLLHIKDGPGNREDAMLAAGDGVMDIPAIVKAGAGHTEWLIIELDRCDTDMLTAVQRSYDYMVDNGLAKGNK